MPKILIVDDDEALNLELKTFFEFNNFTVSCVSDGSDASGHLKMYSYDLIILDWHLPGTSGIEICRNFRSAGGQTPVLMLTGRTDLEYRVEGLNSGADDYLSKPFHLSELLARVNALLRRSKEIIPELLSAGDLTVDLARRKIFLRAAEIVLSSREFELIAFLVRNPNQVFSADALLNKVWPSESEATVEVVRVTIKRIRTKLDPNAEILTNVYGSGYMLCPPNFKSDA